MKFTKEVAWDTKLQKNQSKGSNNQFQCLKDIHKWNIPPFFHQNINSSSDQPTVVVTDTAASSTIIITAVVTDTAAALGGSDIINNNVGCGYD